MRLAFAAAIVLASGGWAAALAQSASGTETVHQALCRLIETSARAEKLPVEFLTRLIWTESSFRTGAVSPAGARGVAQFMPGTAAERGLADPFDPEQAIPKSAELLADHVRRFGNLGLAAAAYNGGPNRVANWKEGRGGLPDETRTYVERITGRSAEEWRDEKDPGIAAAAPSSCLEVVAILRRPGVDGSEPQGPVAPWGVQLAGNFSKSTALASYRRARKAYASLLPDVQPMIIGTRMRSRGTRAFYRVRVPAQTRVAATGLCERIRKSGGSCVVLPS